MSLLGSAAPRPRLPSPGEILGLAGSAFSHRTELASLEFEEAREHAARSALMGGIVVLLTFFTGFAFTLFVAALAWDSPHRAAWIGGLCAAYLVGGVALAFALRSRLRNWQPMSDTQAQLREDRQCLEQLVKSVVP